MSVPVCARCGGQIVYGKPLIIRDHRKTGIVELPFCQECMDEYRWAFWDEETMGPFVSKLTSRHGGHA